MGMTIWRRRAVTMVAALGLTAVALTTGGATARTQEPSARTQGSIPAGETFAVIPMKNVSSDQGGNDVVTALRNVLTRAHIYYVYTQHALAIRGTQQDVDTARTMVAKLDKPHVGCRLTYTITVKDGGRTVDTRHFELALDSRGKAEMKQGSRVPIVTGTSDTKSGPNSQVQYLDVGLMITAEMDGAGLRSKVEESKLSGNSAAMGIVDPVVGQTVLIGETPLVAGKTLLLGALDVPNSTRQEVVEVTAQPAE
jgi:type II secretory pathway component GspD/PulD (secretin)